MNRPIRDLLERRPLRNAVRSLLGMEPKYGSSRMDTMQATDSMQGADLDAAPKRLKLFGLPDNTAYQRGTTTQPAVAPSPEARVVAMNRTQDGQRRQQAIRKEEGIESVPTPPPQQPSSGFAMAMPIANTNMVAPPNPLLGEADRMQAQATQLYTQAEAMQGNTPLASAQRAEINRRADQFSERASSLRLTVSGMEHTDRMATSAEGLQVKLAEIKQPPDGMMQDAEAFASTVRKAGVFTAAQIATDKYYAAAQLPGGPQDPAYQQRLLTNQLTALPVAVADEVSRANKGMAPYRLGDPSLVELATVLRQAAPDDPAKRRNYISQIVYSSNAYQTARMKPDAAKRFNAYLINQVEQQIAEMEAE